MYIKPRDLRQFFSFCDDGIRRLGWPAQGIEISLANYRRLNGKDQKNCYVRQLVNRCLAALPLARRLDFLRQFLRAYFGPDINKLSSLIEAKKIRAAEKLAKKLGETLFSGWSSPWPETLVLSMAYLPDSETKAGLMMLGIPWFIVISADRSKYDKIAVAAIEAGLTELRRKSRRRSSANKTR